MREYGQIQCSFWTDPEIKGLTDQGCKLAAYLLTGPHSNGLGCYQLPDGYVMADLKWDSERVSKAFDELFQIGFCIRCKSTDFVLIPKFLKWNPISNGNVASARVKEFKTVPKNSEVFQELISCIQQYGKHFKEDFETILKGFAEGFTKQDPTKPKPIQPKQEPICVVPEVTTPEPEAAIRLILNDKTEYPITFEQVNKFSELYPAVNVMQQLRNMLGWLEANPSRRKTKNGILRFVNSWLTKEQDKGGTNANQQQNSGTRQSLAERATAGRSAFEKSQGHG